MMIIHCSVQYRLEPSHASAPTARHGSEGISAVYECACGFSVLSTDTLCSGSTSLSVDFPVDIDGS